MSREIKLRAWNPKGISMQYRILKEFQEQGFGLPLDNPETEIMQFTGLKDRMGKEIYEGDKVIVDSNKDFVCEVVWNKGSWGLHGSNYANFLSKHPNVEIIGNIYETNLPKS